LMLKQLLMIAQLNNGADHAPEAGPLPLTALRRTAKGRVVRVDNGSGPRMMGYGILPGVEIRLEQKYPSYVVRCDNTEVALETSVARDIWVQPED
jgi:DtxR family transcriptional regulator, Mn-dependent transcriptional regulator